MTSIFALFACTQDGLCDGGSVALNRSQSSLAALVYVVLPMFGILRLLQYARRHANDHAVHVEIYGAMGLGKYDQHVRAA